MIFPNSKLFVCSNSDGNLVISQKYIKSVLTFSCTVFVWSFSFHLCVWSSCCHRPAAVRAQPRSSVVKIPLIYNGSHYAHVRRQRHGDQTKSQPATEFPRPAALTAAAATCLKGRSRFILGVLGNFSVMMRATRPRV